MKVLHVCPWPGPPLFGGNTYVHHFLRNLAPRHRCRLIVIRYPYDSAVMTREALADVGIPAETLDIVDWPQASGLAWALGVTVSRWPPGLGFLQKVLRPHLKRKIESIVAEWKPDLLVVWRALLAAALHDVRAVPKVLHACDSYSMVKRSRAENTRDPVRRLLRLMFARRYARYEREFFPHYDEVIFISQRDADYVALPPEAPVSVIRNGVDTETLRPSEPDAVKALPPRVIYHGWFDYLPNAVAVRFLADKIGPRLERELGRSGFEIRVCGQMRDHKLREHLARRPWMKVMGYVDDLQAELAAAAVYAAPISIGGGVKNKVLEAMACGLPVVGTPEAFSGLDLTPGVHGVLCPLDGVADELVRLLRDPERCRHIGEAAREWVLKNVSWQRSSLLLEDVLKRACGAD